MGAVKENLRPEDTSLALQKQEISFEHPDSRCMFDGPFYSTSGVLEVHGADTIARCHLELQQLAGERNGLDYLQVFCLPSGKLWLIDSGHYVTALLPDEY